MRQEQTSIKAEAVLRKAFDEMNGTGDGVRVPYQAVSEWLGAQKLDDLKQKVARGGDDVPANRHHLRRLRQRRGRRAPHPLRHHPTHHRSGRMAPSHGRHRAARARAQRVHVRHLPPPGDHQGREGSRGAGRRQLGVRSGDDRRRAAARHLQPHHRHRHRAHQRERFLRARGQYAHALGRLVHAREPRNDDAHVPRPVCQEQGGAGRELSGALAQDAGKRGAQGARPRADHRAADARPIQQRLLRALVPRRPDGCRARRGP